MQQPNSEQSVALNPVSANSGASNAPMPTESSNSFTSSPTMSTDSQNGLSPTGQSVLSKLQGKGGLSGKGQDLLDKLQKNNPQVPGIESSSPNAVSDSWTSRAITTFNNAIEDQTSLREGFNHGMEQIGAGLIDKALMVGDKLNGTNTRQMLQSYMSQKEQEFQGLKKINPVTATVGDAIGKIGALIPALALSTEGVVAGSIISGAASAASTYNPEQKSLADVAKDAIQGGVVGAFTGGVLGVVGKGLSISGQKMAQLGTYLTNVWKGSQFLTKSPDDIVNQVIENSGAGVNSKATLLTASNSFNDLRSQVKDTANSLYAARNHIATELDAKVNFTNLQQSLTPKTLVNGELIDPRARQFVQKLVKNAPDDLPFQIGHKLMSQIGGAANDAKGSGEASLARSYDLLKDQALKDLDLSANGNELLKQSQSVANSFYANSYSPLKDTAVANSITDKFVNTNLVQNLLTHLNTNETAGKTWNILPEDIKQQFTMAYVNALRAGKTDSAGDINLSGFANQLKQATDKIPQLSQVGVNIDSITKIAAAAGKAQKGLGALGKGGMAAGLVASAGAALIHPAAGAVGVASTLAGAVYAKMPLLATAGKLLNSQSLQPIMQGISNSDKIAEPIMNNLLSKAVSAYTAMQYQSVKEQEDLKHSVSIGIRD